jgi:hypothetical protein
VRRDGLVRDVLGNHRLAQSLRRDEDDVASALEEVEVDGGLDGGLVDARRPRPVEVRHRRDAAQLAVGQASLDAAGYPLLRLLDDEVAEQFTGAPAILRGPGDEVVEVFRREVEAEFGELLAEGDARHDSPSFFESES